MASTLITKNLKKIVKELVKENGIWIFADTKCKANEKVCCTWTSLFQAFKDKEFLMLLQDYARNELSKEI